MKVNVPIKPETLEWAIRRAGEDIQSFVEKNPIVGQWLSSEKIPTLKQLETFSQKVHVPFGYLLLPVPPEEHLPIPYFRTGAERNAPPGLNVFDTVLLIQQRQQWLTEYLINSHSEPLPFVGRFRVEDGYEAIVDDIRRTLGLREDWANACQTWERALDHLTNSIEEVGIIVSFNSIVENNTHRSIPVDECRGFVLVNEWVPFLFINSADAKGAQLFTLVHELAHIWLGASAGFDNSRLLPADNPIELLCDKVAAEFLVPARRLLQLWTDEPEIIRRLSKYFKVSQIVIARRALDLRKISKGAFFSFYNRYMQEAEQRKEQRTSGGDFYNTQKKRLSLRFTAYVTQAVRENRLLYRDAYRITGLKANTFDQFVTKHLN